MEASRILHEMPKPTIAMVNGVAAGAGMSLMLACDMRIGGASARMGTAFGKMGFSGDFGGHWFLNRLVGPAKARELYFTAEVIDAAEMYRLGLLNKLVADAELEATTMALAKQLAAGPRVAWHHMKRNMQVAEQGTLVGRAGCRGLRHDPLPRHRGPPGSAEGLRREAPAGLHRAAAPDTRRARETPPALPTRRGSSNRRPTSRRRLPASTGRRI